MERDDVPRFQFGPLERRGLLLGLGPLRLGVLGATAFLAVAAAAAGAAVVGVFVLALGAGFTLVPLRGRTACERAPVLAAHLLRKATGEARWHNDSPLLGHRGTEPTLPTLPRHLRGVRLEAARGPFGAEMGVVLDHGTMTAVLEVRPVAFALAEADEQARRLAGWGSAVSGLGREGSPVTRVQWVERTAPADDGELSRAARDRLGVPEAHLLAASYLELVDQAGPTTQLHECHVALQVEEHRAGRFLRHGGDEALKGVLRRELATFAQALATAEVEVIRALPLRELARAIRVAHDPTQRPAMARRAALDPQRAGLSPGAAWPMATEERWSSYGADDAFHATYWVEEWPRTPVRPGFLSPLLVGSLSSRAMSVVVEPVPPGRAARAVERARVSDVADEELRSRVGLWSSARRRRQAEGTARREEELADGHADCRFSGYVTVSAKTPEALEAACSEIEQLAQQCRLQLTPLSGAQPEAFAYTLPLARGLR